jgi:signal transduction histidine kinase
MRIKQPLMKTSINTRKMTSPSVVVSTQQIDNQIIIIVNDNGIGMSEATKAKVFQPFFTTKPTGQRILSSFIYF